MNVYFLDEYRRDPEALAAAIRRHPCGKQQPRYRLTRRGRIVANTAAFLAILAFCTLMGLVGYLEGM